MTGSELLYKIELLMKEDESYAEEISAGLNAEILFISAKTGYRDLRVIIKSLKQTRSMPNDQYMIVSIPGNIYAGMDMYMRLREQAELYGPIIERYVDPYGEAEEEEKIKPLR